MYQHELIGIVNTRMLQAIRYRESIDEQAFPEERRYWHGVYKAYEETLQLLTMVDIRQINPEAPALTPLD